MRENVRRSNLQKGPLRIAPAATQLAFAFFLCGVLPAQQFCNGPVVLRSPQGLSIFNAHQEEHLGDIEAEWLGKEYEVISDNRLTAYLSRIAGRLQAEFPITNQKVRALVIDTPEANSFSVGANRIYLARQMVGMLRNDDELAGLLAHEMVHLYRHENAVLVSQMLQDILGVTSVSDRKDISAKYGRLLNSIGRDKNVLRSAAVRRRLGCCLTVLQRPTGRPEIF